MHRWKWRGIYNDGSSIEQGTINPATNKNWSSDHLDLAKLRAVVYEPLDPGQPKVIYEIRPGEKFKRFWRQYHVVGGASSTTWSFRLDVDDVSFFSFFRGNGSVVLTTNPEGSEFKSGNPNTIEHGYKWHHIMDKETFIQNDSVFSLSKDGKTIYSFIRETSPVQVLITTDPSGSFVL